MDRSVTDRRPRSRVMFAAAGIVAVTVALLTASYLRRERRDAETGERRALIAAADASTFRTIEPRIAGLAYRPWRPVARGAAAGSGDDLAMFRAAAGIAGRGAETSAEHLHAFGLAELLLGNSVAAADLLQTAVSVAGRESGVRFRGSPDPELLTDFAAACFEDAVKNGRPLQMLRALEEADLAWEASKSPAAAWNRGLALERLQLREDAATAWREYLKVETDAAWRAEAANHLQRVSAATDADLWPDVRRRLLADSGQKQIIDAATRFPQQVRMLIEEELLPQWGQKTVSGDTANANSIEARARALSAALAAHGGDAMSRDVLAVVDASSADVRLATGRGYVAYGEGIAAYRQGDLAHAVPALQSARAAFVRASIQAGALADLRLASCDYFTNDYELVHRDVERIRFTYASFLARYPGWAGQVEWLAGLESLSRGHADQSFACYRRAVVHFAQAGERENLGAAHELVAENRSVVGDDEVAWAHRVKALEILSASGSWRRGGSAITELAEVATSIGANRSARRLLRIVLQNAERNHNAEIAAHICLWKAILESRSGSEQAARNELARAKRWEGEIPSSTARERLEADAAIVDAMFDAGEHTSPLIDMAIRFFETAQNTFMLEQALVARARRAPASIAMNDYRRALALAEQAGDDMADPWQRAVFFGSFDAASDRLVDLLLAGDDPVRALEIADAARGRVLSQLVSHRERSPKATVPTLHARELAARLPPGVAIVEIATRERETIAWRIERDSIRVQRLPVPRARLDASLKRLQSAPMDDPRSTVAWRMASSDLFDLLIRPLGALPADGSRLIIIPDSHVENVPFAALYDSERGLHMVERFEVDVAPAAALLRLGSSKRERVRAAIFGNPSFDLETYPRLPLLPGAEAEANAIAAIYDRPLLATRDAARKSTLLGALLHFDIVHFGGHGLTSAERPALSRLLLARDGDADGALHASELVQKQMHVQTVVLSACSTGFSERRGRSGANSIAKAFISGGAGAVGAPLWDIDDASAAPFFCSLHIQLAKRVRLGAAARAAQCEAIRNARVPASIWASFQVIDRDIEEEN